MEYSNMIKSSVDGDVVCECDSGWNVIIQNAVYSIESYLANTNSGKELLNKARKESNRKFYTQIKEKFGGLRIYVSYHDDFIIGVIAMAENMSKVTCEITGNSGVLCKKFYNLKTLDPYSKYAIENGYVPFHSNDKLKEVIV
jgi:hypothetical protein